MKTKPIFARAVAVLSALVFVLTSCGKTETEKTTAPTTQHVHSWTEATPYEPKTCTVCGATEGEKLQPEFEKYGIECNLEVGKSYEYKTHCVQDETLQTKGTLTVKSFEIFDADATHAPKDGYEWRVVKMEVSVRDLNAYDKGFLYALASEDYYGIVNRDKTYRKISDTESEYTVRLDGEDKTVTELLSANLTGWNDFGVNTLRIEYAVHVPKGYDGAVFGLLYPTDRADGQLIFDTDTTSALLFRMK